MLQELDELSCNCTKHATGLIWAVNRNREKIIHYEYTMVSLMLH
jgi:hypothetical protein